jgi:leucyl aminopeptidase
MNVHTRPVSDVAELDSPLVVVPVWQDGDDLVIPRLPAPVDAAVGHLENDARGEEGSRLTAPVTTSGGPRRVGLVGVGSEAPGSEEVRRFAGHAVRIAEELRLDSVALVLPDDARCGVPAAAQAAAEGAVLAAWRFTELKTGDAPTSVATLHLLVATAAVEAATDAASVGRVVAAAENRARDLQSRPGNLATPTHLGEEARRMAEETGMEVEVMGPGALVREGMRAILAVSAGSDEEPRLIVLRHNGGEPGEKPLVLVGKGLTFDAGGISIKPAKGMEEMKYDMSGGAAVLAALWAVARLGVPRNVVGIVPSSENLLGGRALKPGDVITTRSGTTVEVINTDAEGRLILSDALDYARGLDPEAIVDCATLTGAVVVGLGHHAMAVLGTDGELVDEIREAGERSGERAWPLPLWPEYRRQLESETADVKNVGGRPGGTITAAAFLREFVGDVPWAHLDVAGTAYGDGGEVSYRRKGGYGVPTRILVEWVRSRSA